MADAVVGAAVQILLQNRISVSEEQISFVRDFKKDLRKLKESFSMIQDLLDDAEKKQVTEKAVKRWLKKLEDVAFEADNVLDELNYQNLSKKIEIQYKMKKKVRCFFPRCTPNARRLKMARKIKNISKNLEEINGEASKYGLEKTLASAYATGAGSESSSGVETDSFSIDPIFLGRENDVLEIVKMMTTIPNDQVFSIVSIVGMGGLGKSTVAREVYDHERIKTHFDKQFWVHVSKNFDAVVLFKKILASLVENVKLGNKQVLLEKLQKGLGAKRFLLVLDDVWNDNPEIWGDFINPLSRISSVMGNGVIVTTRSESVASLVTTLPIHKLQNLSEDDCWSIIKAKAFREGNIPLEFETVGLSIAKRCQGLPLAAKVVGGLLRDKSIDEWLSIEKDWLSNLGDENSISKILKLSFDNLPSPSVKKCFAYCSIFPKGFLLERKRLVELWMAEGFLQGTDDMEIVGNKFFNLLLQNSLLQVVNRDEYGNIAYSNMHDLVHDLASSVLSPKMSDHVLDGNDQVRYIGLQSISVESRAIPEEQARCLRTLLFNGKVCVIMFSEFKSLHVLILMSDLVRMVVEEYLPSSIRELIHLRCLDISDTQIGCFPDSIGELYQLQTLRACKHLKKLPNALKHLINLRHLYIPRIELPPEMGRLISLQTLPHFGVG